MRRDPKSVSLFMSQAVSSEQCLYIIEIVWDRIPEPVHMAPRGAKVCFTIRRDSDATQRR